MATAASSSNKGAMDQIKDSAGGLLKSITSFPDTTTPPEFLKDYITVPTWQKAARIGFDILMIGAGLLLIYLLSKIMSISDPSIMSLMPMGAGLALSGFGLKFLIEDVIGKENMRTAAKVMAVLTPILLLGGTAALVGAGLHSWMGGFGFNAYFMAGIIMLPLTVAAIKHSASAFKNNNSTYYRRALPPVVSPRSIPPTGSLASPYDQHRPED